MDRDEVNADNFLSPRASQRTARTNNDPVNCFDVRWRINRSLRGERGDRTCVTVPVSIPTTYFRSVQIQWQKLLAGCQQCSSGALSFYNPLGNQRTKHRTVLYHSGIPRRTKRPRTLGGNQRASNISRLRFTVVNIERFSQRTSKFVRNDTWK